MDKITRTTYTIVRLCERKGKIDVKSYDSFEAVNADVPEGMNVKDALNLPTKPGQMASTNVWGAIWVVAVRQETQVMTDVMTQLEEMRKAHAEEFQKLRKEHDQLKTKLLRAGVYI